MDNFMSKQ